MILLKIVLNVELAHLKMQNNHKNIFIIAGEVSGDVLGGRIMQQMPEMQFVGIGCENMQRAGLKSIFPMSDLAVMGIIEVLAHARTLTARINQTVNRIIAERPDIVLTIDAPGFAKGVIKKLRKTSAGQKLIESGLQFHHVVAPQVWAWRSGRAKKYAKTFDKLYAFFEFEVPYFTKHGLDTVAVGHPIANGLIGKKSRKSSEEKIISLIPGSRMSEVKRLLPVMHDTMDMLCRNGYTGYKFVIPVVEPTEEYIKNEIKHWRFKPELVSAHDRYDLFKKTYIAIAASGTVSAELAMLHIPTIVVYKMNPITTWIGKQIIKVEWVSLVNILLNRTVYPEILGNNVTPENILNAFQQLTIPSNREKIINDLTEADKLWLPHGIDAAQTIAQHIQQLS